MARVDVMLNGRSYPVACDDGQEARVRDIGAYVDQRMADIRGQAATVTDTQLLAMVSLLLADELFDLQTRAEAQARADAQAVADAQAHAERMAASAPDPNVTAMEADAVGRLAERIEHLASRLEQA